MKRLLCLLLALVLCPVCALSELELVQEKNYITFPQLDQMKCYFRTSSKWLIVHQGNLEEHMDRLLQRGDTEEEIRARFTSETLLWEAYHDDFPKDACIRMERFVTEDTREIWHLRHLKGTQRKELLQCLNDGLLLEGYDTFGGKIEGNGGTAYIACGFTTVPPAAHESGRMQIRYLNGQAYVLTYAVYGRMAGRSKLRSGRENDLLDRFSPFNSLRFGAALQPRQPGFALDTPIPQQAGLGDLLITGQVTKGAEVAVTVDGKKVSCTVSSKGAFRATLPLTVPGDHQVVFTTTHRQYTDREDTFIINASNDRTALALTSIPENVVLTGQHTVSGLSSPGAEIVLRLDGRDAVTLTSGADGSFSHTFDIMDDGPHQLLVAASSAGQDISIAGCLFYTEYEAFKDGLKAFEHHLTSATVDELSQSPAAHLCERVKISVQVKGVTFTEEGLGILCTHNPPKGSRHAKTPLYLTLYGYAQDQIQPGMTMTVYGTVNGTRTVEGEERLDILMQYGTYLVSR